LAEVPEVSEAGLVRHHEQDVIVSPSMKEAGMPTGAFVLTSKAKLQCPGDYLVERWVAGHRVWQLARLFRVGASELDRGCRAAAFTVAGIQIYLRRLWERHTHDREQTAEEGVAG